MKVSSQDLLMQFLREREGRRGTNLHTMTTNTVTGNEIEHNRCKFFRHILLSKNFHCIRKISVGHKVIARVQIEN